MKDEKFLKNICWPIGIIFGRSLQKSSFSKINDKNQYKNQHKIKNSKKFLTTLLFKQWREVQGLQAFAFSLTINVNRKNLGSKERADV